jgi:4-hydroxy-tetrahydrodipicolinate reductase
MRIVINGANGTMGKLAYNYGKELGLDIYGVDISSDQSNIKLHLSDVKDTHVIIDFSHFSQIKHLLEHALKHKIALVIATTGYDDAAEQEILNASKHIPIFKSANLSLGVHIMNQILKDYARILDETYDIEIIEKHHKHKIDAPSGTARMLFKTIESTLDRDIVMNLNRSGQLKKRSKKEIGIQSLRGGSIVGEHTVVFAGDDDVIEITHIAQTKMMFIKGAYKASKFIVNQKPGMYQMDDLFKEGVK